MLDVTQNKLMLRFKLKLKNAADYIIFNPLGVII